MGSIYGTVTCGKQPKCNLASVTTALRLVDIYTNKYLDASVVNGQITPTPVARGSYKMKLKCPASNTWKGVTPGNVTIGDAPRRVDVVSNCT